ncbi:Septation initiation network scaffold cdc11 [Paramyrothecium foliicola]|nr:Septation initiation network scaffold cdc11 [Paramyrothecium foliicola]
MAPAWLDSLSEDWVSQPGSDISAGQLPPLKDSQDRKTQLQEPPSRIPRIAPSSKPLPADANDSIIIPLSERSANDVNIAKHRTVSKPLQELKLSYRGAGTRSISVSTTASVVHNTVQHQLSPLKDEADTPEWKRRLVYGDLQYGEQRDLFCSAAAGLQDIFKPPVLEDESRIGSDGILNETTLPSSPPMQAPRMQSPSLDGYDESDEDGPIHPADITPSPSPRRPERDVKYKINDDFSAFNDSNLSSILQNETPITRQRRPTQLSQANVSLDIPSEPDEKSRKTSGQSVTQNEDFSPILIGKRSDEEGKIDFAPIELPAQQLKQKLERLRAHQMLLDSHGMSLPNSPDIEDQGTPGIETTEDYARNGGFINTRRGGRSAEGSFRYRALSPGIGVDTSEMLPEESLQASTPKQFPTIRTEGTTGMRTDISLRSPSIPQAPFPSPEKRQTNSVIQDQANGSPLKLFGPYDTFTNQTLLRRISQFEEGMSDQSSNRTFQFDIRDEASNPEKKQRVDDAPPQFGGGYLGDFGTGRLEGFQFDGDVSRLSNTNSSIYADKENISPAGLPVPKAPFFEMQPRDASPDADSELLVYRKRNKSSVLSSSKHARHRSVSSQSGQYFSPLRPAPGISLTPKRDSGSEGKRPRTSPSKDPTPKRRRTLHRSDIAFGREEQTSALDIAHWQMQYALSKKRKDARPGDFQLADPEVLALRKIIRPRTPTPSQRSSQYREQHPFATVDERNLSQDLEGMQMQSSDTSKRSPLRMILTQDATQTRDLPGETDRKPSIRTQDFVDQAAQIMAMIRNQVRAPGLTSVEESEAENGLPSPDILEDSYQESTKEPFSRPPSREGKPMSRLPQRQEDPELLNRLKQYQELSDMGDIISSSMRSVGLAKDAIRVAREVEERIHYNNRLRSDIPIAVNGETISDLPNVRITSNPVGADIHGSPSRDFPSNSSGHSTNRTYPTASSQGSESRKTILPESVSHLIPERVGSMFLDKQNNIWIKRKESHPHRIRNILPSEDSEEDPFASIPDLSVDLTKELQGLRISAARKEEAAGDGSLFSDSQGTATPSRGYVTLSPNARLSPEVVELTREEFRKLDVRALRLSEEEEVDDVRNPEELESNPTSTTRRRNLTISFSSPIASIIHDVGPEDLDCLEDDLGNHEGSVPGSQTPQSSSTKLHDQTRGSNRRVPLRAAGFIPRPVSRIDEQDEDSTVELNPEDQRQLSVIGETSILSHKTPGPQTSLSFIVNHTPGARSIGAHADHSALIGQNVGKLSLSPLSEFTLNNSDQSFGFEVSYVMNYRHMETGDGSKKVMSMTIRELVDRLGEVEPCEPFWEDLTELDLHGKRLSSLHMLDEFCGKVVTLDASQNTLAHLEGVPSSVRQLKVSQNMLTELTSWDHLMNLQYVDISGNEVRSLSALKNLVHLRSIKADDNQLTSLDGLLAHDGLLSLRARNNLIEKLDFAEVKLERLTELDLENNLISSIDNLELLASLVSLNVAKNKLQSFALTMDVKGLRHLDLSDNDLESLDLNSFQSLHTLHADRNRIMSLTGCHRARRLDSLSLREQRSGKPMDLGFLSSACEVRKLFLSGNYLGTFEPQTDFLNLQLLELANCGLQSLPLNMGQLMPNLRNLNMNFNGISDLSPLRYIPRLKKLLVAGNRLTDSTMVMELLTEFPHLAQLDLRDNPVTLGFYAPLQIIVSTAKARSVDLFTLPDADVENDKSYASRLDTTTVLRRRLHQVVFVANCKRLRKLDGLPVQRSEFTKKDDVYQSLIAEGLLPEAEETLVEERGSPVQTEVEPKAQEQQYDSMRSSRWAAEDSFA